MTHATKAVMKLLLSDNVRLQANRSLLYTEQELQNCIDKIEVVDYHQTVEHKGIKFTATAAGHVLGAAMFMIDIDSTKVLYTGDYSLEEDRHLIQAEIPPGGPPDVLIVESTFGTTNIPPREQRESDFTNTVESIVSRRGSCLIPVFALGRAQELLLILDEYWRDNAQLQSIPIFYASKLATKSLRVYQTFINMMNEHIRHLMDQFRNPFHLQHVKNIAQHDFDVLGPCVVMASPGFLQSGVSRALFESWCDDEKNGVIIAGYTIEGTLAHDLLSDPTEIKCLDNRIKPRRCQIEHISFSAHVDYAQNKRFIKSIMPDYIILVHGEKTQMKRLKEGLEGEIKRNWSTTHKPSIATPENGVKVKLRFRKNIIADVVGDAASGLLSAIEQPSQQKRSVGDTAKGAGTQVDVPPSLMLVTENFTSKLVQATELANHTICKFGRITQRQNIPIPPGFFPVDKRSDPLVNQQSEKLMQLVMSNLEEVFDCIQMVDAKSPGSELSSDVSEVAPRYISIQNLISVYPADSSPSPPLTLSHLVVEWAASPVADTVADCVTGIILQAFSTTNLLRFFSTEVASTKAHTKTDKNQLQAKSRKRKTAMKQKEAETVKVKNESLLLAGNEEHEEKRRVLIEDMKLGNVDPSKRLSLSSSSVNKEQLASLQQQLSSHPSVSSYFSSIQCNADGDKLIFRSLPDTSYSIKTLPTATKQENTGEQEDQEEIVLQPTSGGDSSSSLYLEAYCFVLFGDQIDDGGGSVADTALGESHAVVHSSDDAFRKCVLLSLRKLGAGCSSNVEGAVKEE